jgi:hypothetical protein
MIEPPFHKSLYLLKGQVLALGGRSHLFRTRTLAAAVTLGQLADWGGTMLCFGTREVWIATTTLAAMNPGCATSRSL